MGSKLTARISCRSSDRKKVVRHLVLGTERQLSSLCSREGFSSSLLIIETSVSFQNAHFFKVSWNIHSGGNQRRINITGEPFRDVGQEGNISSFEQPASGSWI
jgi:hypothetical protein